MPYKLNVNGKVLTADVDADTPLLWTLRDTLGIVGPKFGCGVGACGACTVHLDGKPVRSCQVPVSTVGAKSVTPWARRCRPPGLSSTSPSAATASPARS
jgi:isoquinoline 1-oxidoreductase alpha subunit